MMYVPDYDNIHLNQIHISSLSNDRTDRLSVPVAHSDISCMRNGTKKVSSPRNRLSISFLVNQTNGKAGIQQRQQTRQNGFVESGCDNWRSTTDVRCQSYSPQPSSAKRLKRNDIPQPVELDPETSLHMIIRTGETESFISDRPTQSSSQCQTQRCEACNHSASQEYRRPLPHRSCPVNVEAYYNIPLPCDSRSWASASITPSLHIPAAKSTRSFATHYQEGSPPWSSASTMPSPPSTPEQAHRPRACQSYDLAEVHFIQYLREDKREGNTPMEWKVVLRKFQDQFGNRQNITAPGLQGRYYRAQWYPRIDANGEFVRDAENRVRMRKFRVRDRVENKELGKRYEKYFTLVSRSPEEAMKYSWVNDKDKDAARDISAERERTGEVLEGAAWERCQEESDVEGREANALAGEPNSHAGEDEDDEGKTELKMELILQ